MNYFPDYKKLSKEDKQKFLAKLHVMFKYCFGTKKQQNKVKKYLEKKINNETKN